MAAPWETKGPIYEYSFYECKTGLATQWGPWGHTDTSGQDGPVTELHEHLCAAFGAGRISQITWHKDPAPGSRLKPKSEPELELESDPEDYFEPSRDCRRRTHPLDELYPNPASVPLKIGNAIVYLHVDKGATTTSSSDQKAREHLQPGSSGGDHESSTDSAVIEATSPAASSTIIPPNIEKPNNTQPKATRKNDKGKGRAIEQEQGEEEAQLGATSHATSSGVEPPTESSSIGSNRTREGAARLERITTASAASAPSRKVPKSEEHKLQWNQEMKLCLWVMEEAFGTQLGDWGRKADVWNQVFIKAFERQLRAQLSEHVKAEKKYQAHKPAIKQWVDIKAMDKQGEGFRAMERKVQAAIAALDKESGWTR
ncbi:hypothetical protein CB0940_06866 [Cercospora beticola]|uniref:Uncharacterized protein n=1 Tax=Cercospora beticola TaxID=122368 RepID=A0A2G5H988_CERBT|nr:hypothetical protein CB0940_06866 [Cercospora beticola]PIA89097.1 hypothetical protein CB0940_06866 [Cercospora beticola]WPB02782.1 hypothetical protein RHO25_007418 [Cercospora beticola]